MVYGGIKGLTTYSESNKSWGQAHCLARWAIYKILREHGFVDVVFSEKEGKDYFEMRMKTDQIATEGLKIIGDFLTKLQVMKSFGDIAKAKPFWDKYSALTDEELRMRTIVINWKKPRSLEVQCELELKNEKIHYAKFEESFEGIIKSFIGHYQHDLGNVLEEYTLNKHLFRPDHFEHQKAE